LFQSVLLHVCLSDLTHCDECARCVFSFVFNESTWMPQRVSM